jgi:hypothetical protein
VKWGAWPAPVCVIVVLAGILAACSGGRQMSSRTVTPAPGVDVRLPAGSAAVTAVSVPAATSSLTAPIHLPGGPVVPNAITVVAPARHLAIRGHFPAGGVDLTFRVRAGAVSPGTSPFLASQDPGTGRWTPVQSTYNAAAGTVSARVTHFSTWAVLDWARPEIEGILRGALSDIFDPAVSGPGGPDCGSASTSGDVITVSDSQPSEAIGACAQVAGQSQVTAKVADHRAYPVDLNYPHGSRVSPPSADVFTQLGADLNNLVPARHNWVVLPGNTEADVTLALASGNSAMITTEMDDVAYLTAILGTGLSALALATGKLAVTTAFVLDKLAKGACLRDLVHDSLSAPLSQQSAESLGSLGFECVFAAAKLGAAGVVAAVAGIISSLASQVLATIWRFVDIDRGNASHVLTLSRSAACPSSAQLLAVWDAAPASLRDSWAAPGLNISGFQGISCWSSWVVTAPIAQTGNGIFVFSQQGTLHIFPVADLQQFRSAVCASPDAPTAWRNETVADCQP